MRDICFFFTRVRGLHHTGNRHEKTGLLALCTAAFESEQGVFLTGYPQVSGRLDDWAGAPADEMSKRTRVLTGRLLGGRLIALKRKNKSSGGHHRLVLKRWFYGRFASQHS